LKIAFVGCVMKTLPLNAGLDYDNQNQVHWDIRTFSRKYGSAAAWSKWKLQYLSTTPKQYPVLTNKKKINRTGINFFEKGETSESWFRRMHTAVKLMPIRRKHGINIIPWQICPYTSPQYMIYQLHFQPRVELLPASHPSFHLSACQLTNSFEKIEQWCENKWTQGCAWNARSQVAARICAYICNATIGSSIGSRLISAHQSDRFCQMVQKTWRGAASEARLCVYGTVHFHYFLLHPMELFIFWHTLWSSSPCLLLRL